MFALRVLSFIAFYALISITAGVANASIRGEIESIARLDGRLGSQTPNTAELLHHFSRKVQKTVIPLESYTYGFVRNEKDGRRSFHFDLLGSAFIDELDFAELAFTDYDQQVRVLDVLSSPLLKVFFKDSSHCEFRVSAIDPKKLALVQQLFSPDSMDVLFPFARNLQVGSVAKLTLTSRNMDGIFDLLGSQLFLPIQPENGCQFEFIHSQCKAPKDYVFPMSVQTLKQKLTFCAAQIDLLEITAPMRNISPGSNDPAIDEAKACYQYLKTQTEEPNLEL